MSIQYQALLGDSSIDADAIVTSELDATDANITNLKVITTSSGVLTTNTLKLPTNAALNNVLTCVNLNGTAAWRPPVDVNLAGDAVGIAGGNRVDTLAGGTILVSNLVTLAGSQTLTNKTLENFTVSGMETLQKNMWFGNSGQTKLLALWDSGNINDQTQHNFYGFGIGSTTLRYQVGSTAGAHVFYSSLTASTSNELFRIGGNGLLTIPGSLILPTGAADGRILTSDNLGNAIWMDPAVVTSVGNLTMSGYLFNTAGRYLLANKSASSSLFLGEGGNSTANGLSNVICGPSAYNMTSAAYTTAIGTSVLPNLSTAFFTTAAGYQSLPTLTTGNSNTAIGVDAGRGITTGANNTFLGEGTNATVSSISGSTCIGTGAYVTTSNTIALGGSNVTNVNTYGEMYAPSIVTGGLSATAATVENLNARSYRAPTAQGTYVTWNRDGGTGKACWGNQRGYGGGGHEWVEYNIGTSTTTVGMSLAGTILTVGGISLPKNGAFGDTLKYYEEYIHVIAFLGPVITDLFGMKITQIGNHVTLYMPNGPAYVADTGGIIGWGIGIKLPERFRPSSNVNGLLIGKNNGATTLVNVLVDSLGGVTLSVALTSTTWAGNIGFNTFSLSWTLGL